MRSSSRGPAYNCWSAACAAPTSARAAAISSGRVPSLSCARRAWLASTLAWAAAISWARGPACSSASRAWAWNRAALARAAAANFSASVLRDEHRARLNLFPLGHVHGLHAARGREAQFRHLRRA